MMPRLRNQSQPAWVSTPSAREVLDRAAQPFLRTHLRLVAQPGTRQGEVRAALLRVVRRPLDQLDRGVAAGQADDEPGQLEHAELMLGAAVDRAGLGGIEQ